MTDAVLHAQRMSRDPRSLADVPGLFKAEEIIAAMPDVDVMELQEQLLKRAEDPFPFLWLGLAAAKRGQYQAAVDAYGHAIDLGCNHWRVGWYIARAARELGEVKIVDQACAAVLSANPKFWFARELPKHVRGYYSQVGQDRTIEEYFAQFPAESKVFVEVGAFDGVHYSNVRRLFEKHGWTGISFEPVGKNFRKLAAAYEGTTVRCVNAAVSTTEGELEINVSTYPHLPEWGSDVATFGEADRERWKREFGATWTKERVRTARLTTLLDEAQITAVDVLSIDTEGHDLEVLKSLDFSRFRPRLIVVEYGEHKQALETLLRTAGYGMLQDNGLDLIAFALPERAKAVPFRGIPVEGPVLKQFCARLNPHLVQLGILPLGGVATLERLAPVDLVTKDRFDLPAKYLYARHRALGVNSAWSRELYREHIRAFSNGTFAEGDGTKRSIEDYMRCFDELLDGIGTNGFDPTRTLVPLGQEGTLIDGAHRVTACLIHDVALWALRFPFRPNAFTSDFFLQRGLDRKWTDAIALEFCRMRSDTFIATLFPSAAGREAEVISILDRCGAGVVYTKAVRLNRTGALNLIREIYAGESWLGDWTNGFRGASGKMEPCFRGDGPVRVLVFQAQDLEAVKSAKAAIRDLYQIENHSVHINDTHAQALHLARLFLNENSIHYLNHARCEPFERFFTHLARYANWLRSTGLDPEQFCIDGSAVLSVYGLRDAQDLDILHYADADFSPVMPEVNSHNPDAHHHTTTRDDIIFNPDNHFYAYGLKFASLETIRRLKAKRNEGKDQRDVDLIEACVSSGGNATPATARTPKIVALLPARNEAKKLPVCLRALKPYVDSVVYLDDCSDDDSVKVVEALAAECKVEHIIRKEGWHRDEPGDRNALLEQGRRLGGTHFVVLDADEAFTANCTKDDYLRRLVLTLEPGDSLALSWIQLWRSLDRYRFDRSAWTYASKAFAFCDDGVARYQSGFIHTLRVPHGLKGREVTCVNYVHGVLHFQFVDWANLQIKQAWYRCMERVRQPGRPAREINEQYAPAENETGIVLRDVPPDWLIGYEGLEAAVFALPDARRIREVLQWFETFGVAHFAMLDIWRVAWDQFAGEPSLAAQLRQQIARGVVTYTLSAAAKQQMTFAGQHIARGDAVQCRTAIECALQESPGHPEILAALGTLLALQGNRAEALKRLEESLAADPQQPKVLLKLGQEYRKAGKVDRAEELLSRVLQMDERNIEALRELSELQLERRLAEGVATARKLVALRNDTAAQVLLGRALAATGEKDAAEKVLRAVLRAEPANQVAAEALNTLIRGVHRPPRPLAVST